MTTVCPRLESAVGSMRAATSRETKAREEADRLRGELAAALADRDAWRTMALGRLSVPTRSAGKSRKP